MKRILVPVDFSTISKDVVATAARMARRLGWSVTLLNVAPREPDVFGLQLVRREVKKPVPDDVADAYRELEALAAEARASEGIECEVLMVRGTPVATILAEARRLEVELIVAGAHDRKSLFKKLLGSVSAGVLERAPCPMLVIPAGIGRLRQDGDPRAA